MRIGIDARLWGPKQGGLGRYVEQLIVNLEKIDTTGDEFVIFLRRENWNDYESAKPNFFKVLADIPWYGWQEQIILPQIFKKEKLDILHFPHWNVPLWYNDPFFVTIHDLLLLHYPTRAASTLGPVSYWFKNKLFRRVLHHAINKAKHIITVSNFSKEDIIKTLGVNSEKISVTYLAPFESADKKNKPLSTPYSPLPSLNSAKPHLLYIGVAYPHKNLETLLRAWKIFQEKYGNNYQLVLVGTENYFYKKLKTLNSELRTTDVIFAGFVPDAELEYVYCHASLYVFPSLYEGFGLPPLEALARGVPVLASNQTSLPEILGDAAYYVDPTVATALADGCYAVLTNQAIRQKILAAAPAVLARYRWESLAKNTLAIYQKKN